MGLKPQNLAIFLWKKDMRPPKHKENNHQDLFRHRLDNIVDMDHELVILSKFIDCQRLDGVPPRKPRNKVVELCRPCLVRLSEASTF